MNGDILLKELPALKINGNDYLIYSPYKRMFARILCKEIDDPAILRCLKINKFFDFPGLYPNSNHSIKVVFNITKKCNLFCKYCWAESNPYLNEKISPYTAIKIVKELSKLSKIERIHFMGGEPTLNFKAIKAIVRYFRNLKVVPPPVFYITTNGIMPAKILKWLIYNEFAFSIAWDGLGVAHNNQRPFRNNKESENKVRNSILQVTQEKFPLLRVRMTISKLNLPYLYDSVSWLADNAVKFVHIEPVSLDGRGSQFARKYAPSPEEFVNEFFRVVALAEEKGIWIMNSSLANLYAPKGYYCSSLKRRVYNFNPDGSISHCYKAQGFNNPLSNHFIVGHYRNEDEFIKIDDAKSSNLSSISVSKYSECEDYFLKNLYSGGCPYRNFKESTSRIKIDLNIQQVSELLLRKAILHIYERALDGKSTSLEGHLHFYGALIHKDGNSQIQNHQKLNAVESVTPFKKHNSIEITSIPIASPKQFAEIDACDICI